MDTVTYTDENKINYRRRALFISSIAIVITYIMWNIPQLNPVMYPVRLFVTYVHEAGHALTAILTGGRIIEFSVEANGSGHVVNTGGIRWLILPAGYIGAALFGSFLFFITNRMPRFANAVAYALGGGMLLFTLTVVLWNAVNPIAIMIGVSFSVALLMVAAKLPQMLTLLVLNVLAIITALNAVFDVFILMRIIKMGSDGNDAIFFAREITPFVPASFIALTWAGISVLLFAMAFYYGAWKPLHSEINDTYNSIRAR